MNDVVAETLPAADQASDHEREAITVSVGRLAELIHRRGDIHVRLERGARPEEGSALHRRLQANRGEGYTAEVALHMRRQCGAFDITARGRADGVLRDDGVVTVEEIKSTRADLESVADHGASAHGAQVRLYAAMLVANESLAGAFVLLRYVHLDDDTEITRRSWCSADELATFADQTFAAYATRLADLARWRLERDAAIRAAGLPFGALRPAQRQLATVCWQVQTGRRTLLGEAPTGTGKTVGGLLPAVHGLVRGQFQRIVFLTARGTGRDAAVEALAALRASGFRLRSVVLRARSEVCFNPELPCDPERCQYARGYYDRRNGALDELLATDHIDTAAVHGVARQHRVCPFELSLDALLWSDVIVGDYNYVFDPNVRILRLAEVADTQHLLIDEAHQLPDRVREMYSARVARSAVMAALAAAADNTFGPRLRRLDESIGRMAIDLDTDGEREVERAEFFRSALGRFNDDCAHELAVTGELPGEVLALYFDTLACSRLWTAGEDAHALIVRRDGNELAVHLRCLDAAPFAGPLVRASASAALLSATIGAPDEFARLLGLGAERHARSLPSPFPRERQRVLVVADIDTFFQAREHTADRLAQLVVDVMASRAGNYLLFAPSFAYLDLLAAALAAHPRCPALLNQRNCTDADSRAAFITRLRNGPPASGGQLGLAVLGGVFAESIDLAGDALIGVFVVGVGLPPASLERELVRGRSPDGFELAYRRPALQKVMQAGGRLIRTESDAGVLVLIDPRFADPGWTARLPAHWQLTPTRAADAPAAAATFWNQLK